MTDLELLKAFVERGDEGAFGALVRGHIHVVYGAALRRVGDPGMAEDVTQAVFIVLAKKAKGIRDGCCLAGWLMEVTRLCAADARKVAGRRRVHERVAAGMKEAVVKVAMGMEMDVRGMVDEGLMGLGEMDRTAVVLRCLEERPLEEVGRMMGVSEEAAKKRVERAVEKMRRIFLGKGMVISVGVIVAGMVKEAHATPLPVGLAEKVLGVALAKGAGVGTAAAIAKGAVKVMGWTVAKILGVAAVGVVVVGLGATGVVMVAGHGGGDAKAGDEVSASEPATQQNGGYVYLAGYAKHPGVFVLPAEGFITMKMLLLTGLKFPDGVGMQDVVVTLTRRTGPNQQKKLEFADVGKIMDGSVDERLEANDVVEVGPRVTKVVDAATQQGVAANVKDMRFAYLTGDVRGGGTVEVGTEQWTLKRMVEGNEPTTVKGWGGYVAVLARRVDAGHEDLSVVEILPLLAGARVNPVIQAEDVVTVVPWNMAAGLIVATGMRDGAVGSRVAIATPVGAKRVTTMVILPGEKFEGSVKFRGEVVRPGASYILMGRTLREMMANAGVNGNGRWDLRIEVIRSGGEEKIEMTWGELVNGMVADPGLQDGDEVVVGANGP